MARAPRPPPRRSARTARSPSLRPRAAGSATPAHATGLGPVTGPELELVGFPDVDSMREAGWEEVCLRWVEAFPLRLNVNAFYGVIAACEGVDWRTLDEGWRARARALRDRLRRG